MATERPYYQMSSEEVISSLYSSKRIGLTDNEISERLQKYGQNIIEIKKKVNPALIFFRQFRSFLIILLIAAAVISAAIQHYVDASVIFAIVIINAVIGFSQEFRAEKAVEALRKLAAPKARVIRHGKEIRIPAAELVPGDIIIIEQGDKIPADARLIEAINLKLDESALTGESVPVSKTIDALTKKVIVAERKNLVFMSTIVTNGRAIAIVISTGMDSEVGKIAKLIEEAEIRETPLQKKLTKVARTLGSVIVAVIAVVFALGLLKGFGLFDMFLTSVSLAVAAVPEGLPAIITITMAIGLERMAKRNAIIRRLPAVETLGSCNIICTDKTGTLTKNEMTVRKIYVNGKFVNVTGEGYIPAGAFKFEEKTISPLKDKHSHLLLHIGTLCNGANLYEEDGKWQITGDPTEAALLVLAAKAGILKDSVLKEYSRISELSFDEKRKRMSTIHKHKGETLAFVKGAPDVLLNYCSFILKDGVVSKLTDEDKQEISNAINKMADSALRILGMAYKPIPATVKKYTVENIESDLIFVGLTGMIDPPRSEAKEALRSCTKAGIKVAMVTGDHRKTAEAIARELGMLAKDSKVIEGAQLEKLSDKEFEKIIDKISVYARVSPEHKVRIVNILQKKNYVVAMTGDGVNDAPALNQADIGIAMGISGTDVAKEASAMVLEDDNFATIVSAIHEGRGVFENIKKSMAFLLAGNIAEILIIFSAILVGLPLPLLAVQILWINLVTDGFPALALSIDPINPQLMERKPRPIKESIFKGLRGYLVDYPLIFFVGAVTIFWWLLKEQNLIYAQTAVFTSVVVFEMFQAFSCHSFDAPIIKAKFETSRWLIAAIAAAILLQVMIVYTPFFQEIFHTTSLQLVDWLIIIAFSSIGFIYLEAYKSLKK